MAGGRIPLAAVARLGYRVSVHEIGIMESALDAALAQARSRGGGRLRRIVLQVGNLSGADPDSLRFAFTALAPLSEAAGAELDIEPAPGRELNLVRLELEA